MIRRIAKTFGFLFLFVVILIAAALAWIMGTEQGFQQSLSMAKKFAPGTLEWSEASGKLGSKLSISELSYSDGSSIDARVNSLEFEWTPASLTGLAVDVEQLHLDGIELRLGEPTAEQETTEPTEGLPDISLPVSVNLKDIVASNMSIYTAGQETPIEVDSVALAVSAEQSDIKLEKLEVIAPQGELRLNGDVTTSGDYPLNMAASWQTEVDPSKPLQGEGTFKGSLAKLEIEHEVSGFALADIRASVSDVISDLSWMATIEASIPEPESLSPLLTSAPSISLETSGKPDSYEASIILEAVTSETGPVAVNTSVSGSTEAITVNTLQAVFSENGSELTAQGEVVFASLQSNLEGQWQDLAWPITATPEFSSKSGQFEVSGTPDNYQVNLSTAIGGTEIPEGQWVVSLDGSTVDLGQFDLKGQTLGGEVTASGTANWEGQPSWDIELQTASINPGIQWQDFPGSINVQLRSNGQIAEQGPQLSADLTELSGNLRNQALSGGGSILLNGEKLTIDNFNITHGSTRIEASGQVDNQIALDFDLNSSDLQTLLPELNGSVSLAGSVSGTPESPMLAAQGNVQSLSYVNNSIDSLRFAINGGLGENTESSINLEATGIAAGAQQISESLLEFNGTQLDHRLVVSAVTSEGDFETQLEGGYQVNTWQGVLTTLQLEKTLVGDWRLREPTSIVANAEKANVADLCLDNGDKLGSLCLQGDWLAEGNSAASLNISNLSPELLADFIPADFELETMLNGDASATLGSNGDMGAEAAFVLEPGKLIINSADTPAQVTLEKTTIDASWLGNEARVELASAFTDFGQLKLQGAISDPAGVGRLSGQFDADFADLTLLSAFVPQVQEVSGALVSKLSVGGTLQAPQIEGELALRDFGAEIPETAMLIEDTQLSVNGSPDGTLIIAGESRSGEGQLQINGKFNPGSRELELNIEGDQYEVANTGVMQAVVSPSLDIAMHDSGMEVSGEVTIPSAYINANGGTEGIKTVSSSSDVVFVTEDGVQEEPPESQISLDVKVNLGDSIEVEAGDFRGKLEGDLLVEQTPGLAPRGTGTINVVNGDYVIYGQQLEMERGKVLFSGGPVDNPSLDMQVARTVQEYDVVAGAKIQGTAQTPRLELYSEPSMPDASILSFILIGQPPGSTGLSYTLGKYLTPDLYVSYGIGLFDAINTFSMRYSLTDKLALEAASGVGSSTDLIYTIEK